MVHIDSQFLVGTVLDSAADIISFADTAVETDEIELISDIKYIKKTMIKRMK